MYTACDKSVFRALDSDEENPPKKPLKQGEMEEEGSFFLGQMQQIKCVQIGPTNVQCKQIMAIFLLNAHTDTVLRCNNICCM